MSATTSSAGIGPVKALTAKVGAIEVFPAETKFIENSTCINAVTHAALPETLKNFCLLEKVVVITGYVSRDTPPLKRHTNHSSLLLQRRAWSRKEHG